MKRFRPNIGIHQNLYGDNVDDRCRPITTDDSMQLYWVGLDSNSSCVGLQPYHAWTLPVADLMSTWHLFVPYDKTRPDNESLFAVHHVGLHVTIALCGLHINLILLFSQSPNACHVNKAYMCTRVTLYMLQALSYTWVTQ